ncbi:hypothetical protein DIPPA_08698 [Diplonema papillatum]|nr:hypothetical protein DIPPA_08698 [Diplonema papillatum]
MLPAILHATRPGVFAQTTPAPAAATRCHDSQTDDAEFGRWNRQRRIDGLTARQCDWGLRAAVPGAPRAERPPSVGPALGRESFVRSWRLARARERSAVHACNRAGLSPTPPELPPRYQLPPRNPSMHSAGACKPAWNPADETLCKPSWDPGDETLCKPAWNLVEETPCKSSWDPTDETLCKPAWDLADKGPTPPELPPLYQQPPRNPSMRGAEHPCAPAWDAADKSSPTAPRPGSHGAATRRWLRVWKSETHVHHTAAVTLQCAHRCHAARVAARRLRTGRQARIAARLAAEEHDPARAMDAVFLARGWLPLARHLPAAAAAARVVQRGFRRARAAAVAAHLREDARRAHAERTRSHAATLLQAMYRGVAQRIAYNVYRRESSAHRVCYLTARVRAAVAESRACRIQAWYRRATGRRREAADAIQRCYRAHAARGRARALRAEAAAQQAGCVELAAARIVFACLRRAVLTTNARRRRPRLQLFRPGCVPDDYCVGPVYAAVAKGDAHIPRHAPPPTSPPPLKPDLSTTAARSIPTPQTTSPLPVAFQRKPARTQPADEARAGDGRVTPGPTCRDRAATAAATVREWWLACWRARELWVERRQRWGYVVREEAAAAVQRAVRAAKARGARRALAAAKAGREAAVRVQTAARVLQRAWRLCSSRRLLRAKRAEEHAAGVRALRDTCAVAIQSAWRGRAGHAELVKRQAAAGNYIRLLPRNERAAQVQAFAKTAVAVRQLPSKAAAGLLSRIARIQRAYRSYRARRLLAAKQYQVAALLILTENAGF